MVQIPASVWNAVAVILAAFGVVWVPSDGAKAAIGAAAGLVLAVYQWQHHKTKRHMIAAEAAVAGQKLDARRQADETAVRLAELDANKVPAGYAEKLMAELGPAVADLAGRVRALETAAGTVAPLKAPPSPVPASTLNASGGVQ